MCIPKSSKIEDRPISTFVVLLITADLENTAFLSSSTRFPKPFLIIASLFEVELKVVVHSKIPFSPTSSAC